MQGLLIPSPLQPIDNALLREKRVSLLVKRDDLIHPQVQGNKWRKLKYNLQEAKARGKTTLLTFGGAYSNHIYAVAAAARLFGFRSIGVIRGEEPPEKSSTLRFATSQGMQLHYLSRADYALKETPDMQRTVQQQFGDFYLVPEGGTNLFALKGVEELVAELDVDYDFLTVACGTGGTLAGLVAGLRGDKQLIGFSSLKGEDTLTATVNALVSEYCGRSFANFHINFDYQFGGYAKTKPELMDFISDFKKQFDIPLEPVYTGKMFYGLFDLIRKDHFPPDTRIVAIHSGGLQGRESSGF
jgi:1-aminocyclopropane-1-carboxylate deaminase/D-cysteine desulfhydrase-like pyridoxal-dependent ACC family enzyme